jgi:asparagine synthase (glutamine-hydrolysing)
VDDLENELERITGRLLERLVESLQGRPAAIALSGGYDSRFIAAMLKKAAYPDLACFSYGRHRNPDLLRAEEIAGRLGIKFIPVVYTDEMIRDFHLDEGFKQYIKFSSNHASMFFMQEYFAMKHIRENGLIPENAVIIPGHSGDFFGGSQLVKHGLHGGKEPLSGTVRRIYHTKYAWGQDRGKTRKSMLSRIQRTLREKDIVDCALPYSAHEDWDLKEKLAKFIVNSCNVYAWFGYEYRLPLYDYELQDFFRDVPFELKASKKLYDSFLRDYVFAGPGLNFESELQPGEAALIKARLKKKIRSMLPGSLIPVTVSRRDPIFYYEITRILRQDLQANGIGIKIRGNSYNSLIVQWYLEHLKGRLPVGGE